MAAALGALLAWLLLALLRRRLGDRLRPWMAALLALGTAVGVLLAAELTIRGYESRGGALSGYARDPDLIWILEPNLREAPLGPPERRTWISTNEYGLRDIETPEAKAPGEFRVLALGDSWTMGSGVRSEECWAKRLQAKLRERYPGRPLTVLNAGQSGFSWFQGYYLLLDLLPRYRPDLVIVGGFNPVSNRQIALMEDMAPSPRLEPLLEVLRHSRVYRVLRRRFARPLAEAPGDPGELVNPLSVRYADAIARTLEQAGVPALFFYHAYEPGYVPGAQAWYGPNRNPELLALPARPGQAALELLPGWDPDEKGLLLPNDRYHPNPAGHEAMAEGLLHYVLDLRLLEGGAPAPPAGPVGPR